MKKPNLFYLSTSLNIGGTEKFLVTLIRELDTEFNFSVGYLKEKGYLGEQLESEGFPVTHVFSLFGLTRALKKSQCDILHTFLYRANVLGRIAGKLAGVPAVVSTQQAIDDWKKPHHVWLDGWSARWCDTIIANSRFAKDLLVTRERIPAEKIRVVYNGFDAGTLAATGTKEALRKKYGLPERTPVIVSVMRLHREKGVDFIPDIAAQLPEAFFLVAGGGPERTAFEQVLSERGLENRVDALGWRQDVPELLKASDIYLLPSREESFPQSVLEAMAVGLPVVAADVGGVQELVDHGQTGLLVPRGDITGFVVALRSILNDPGKARTMGRAGQEKSAQFSQQKMIKGVCSVYRELLSKRKD